MRNLLAAAAALALGGCAVSPSVNYHLWTEKHDDSWIPFQLTDSTVVIGTSATAAKPTTPAGGGGGNGGKEHTNATVVQLNVTTGDTTSNQALTRADLYPIALDEKTVECRADGCVDATVVAAAVPIPQERTVFGLEPASRWMIYTHVAPTYYANSLRLQTLELSVEDKRQETIDTLGALAVGVAKLGIGVAAKDANGRPAAPSPAKLVLPIVIDLADAKASFGDNPKELDLPRNSQDGWTYHARFLDNAEGAGFRKSSQLDQIHEAAVTSLCRPLQMTLTSKSGVRITLVVNVADPDYLTTVPMPPAGTVTFGSLCGANVKMEKAATTPTNQVVSAFFNDVQSLRSVLATKK